MTPEQIQRADTLAQIIATACAASDKSFKAIAADLYISERTLRNWCAGIGAPSPKSFFLGFHVSGHNCWNFLRPYINPELKPITDRSTDTEVLESVLSFTRRCPAPVIREIDYLQSSLHGSDFAAYMDKVCADLHCSLQSRAASASLIYNNYIVEQAQGRLSNPSGPLPDVPMLERAIEGGIGASAAGHSAYTYQSGDADEGLAQLVTRVCEESGLSDRFIARSLDIAESTLAKWKSGAGAPSMVGLLNLYDVCGRNPWECLPEYLYPDVLLAPLTAEDNAVLDRVCLRTAASDPRTVRQIAFLLFGDHGSDFMAYMAKMTADLQCTLQSRSASASLIASNFTIDHARGQLCCPQAVLPDMAVLKAAILKGREASGSGQNAYI